MQNTQTTATSTNSEVSTATAPAVAHRAARRFAALGATALAAIGLTLGAASPALAHDELIDTGLEYEGTSGELSAITFSFSNNIVEVGTEIIITDEAGTSVASAEPEISGRTVRQELDAPLNTGNYQGAWRVVSSDGHPISGEFSLTGTEGADGAIEWKLGDAADADASEEEHSHGEGHESSEDHGDHDHGDESGDTATAEGGNSGAAIAIWVAIAVAVLAAIGGGSYAVKRKKASGATGTTGATSTTEQNDEQR